MQLPSRPRGLFGPRQSPFAFGIVDENIIPVPEMHGVDARQFVQAVSHPDERAESRRELGDYRLPPLCGGPTLRWPIASSSGVSSILTTVKARRRAALQYQGASYRSA